MSEATSASAHSGPVAYRVADIGQADFGRREIDLAEVEMPGLMALRRTWQWPLAVGGDAPLGCGDGRFDHGGVLSAEMARDLPAAV